MIQRLTSTDLQRRTGEAIDAAQRGPVIITSRGRSRAVLMSMSDYRRLSGHTREVYDIGQLTEAELEEIAVAEPPEESKHYDDEVD